MNCPNCGTDNEANSRFCIKCGYALAPDPPPAGGPPQPVPRPAPNLWAIFTIRLTVALLVVWLLRLVLLRLPFTNEARIPDFPMSNAEVIQALAGFAVFLILIAYGQAVMSFWPQSFPSAAGLASAWAALAFIGALAAANAAFARPILILTEEPDFVLAFRLLLLALAIVFAIWAGAAIYHALPAWLAAWRDDFPMTYAELPCPHCGHSNPPLNQFCGHCGRLVTPSTAAAAGTPPA